MQFIWLIQNRNQTQAKGQAQETNERIQRVKPGHRHIKNQEHGKQKKTLRNAV